MRIIRFLFLTCCFQWYSSCALHNQYILILILILLTLHKFDSHFFYSSFMHIGRIPLYSFKATFRELKFRDSVTVTKCISQIELVGPADTREGSQEPEASSRPDPKRPGYVAVPGLAAVSAVFLVGLFHFAPFPASPKCRET